MKRLTAQGKAKLSTEGTPARLTMLEGGTYPYPGFVTFVDTQVEPQTSVVRARAQFPNPESSLLPGQYASVTIGGHHAGGCDHDSQTAVMNTAQGHHGLHRGQGRHSHADAVKLGEIFGNEFIVDEGLEPGSVVVVEGTNKVRPGSPVQGKPVPRSLAGNGSPHSRFDHPAGRRRGRNHPHRSPRRRKRRQRQDPGGIAHVPDLK